MNNKKSNYVFRLSIFVVPSLFIVACVILKINTMEHVLAGYEDKTLIINEVVADNLSGLKDEYDNCSDWIEIYNCSDVDINLLDYGLADSTRPQDRWSFPEVIIEAKQYLIIFADGGIVASNEYLHADFSIKASGETLYLTDANRNTIDIMELPEQETDMSFGYRYYDINEIGFFAYTTPGEDNPHDFIKQEKQYITEGSISFSNDSGFYEDEFELELYCDVKDALILYTVDGSEPGKGSEVYTAPISITKHENEDNKYVSVRTVPFDAGIYTSYASESVDKCNVIRAKIYKNGIMSKETWTKSYYVDKKYDIPVISLSANPNKLFDEANGIYMPGSLYFYSQKINFQNKLYKGNFSLNNSINAHLQIFDSKDDIQIDNDVKLEMNCDADSANSILKNFLISDKYGNRSFGMDTADILEDYTEFSLNGTNDNTEYRYVYHNEYINNMLYTMNVGANYSELSVLYIDGEFWGIYSISEPESKEYYSKHYDIASDSIVLIKNGKLKYGNTIDYQSYVKLYKDVLNKDYSSSDNYEWIDKKIDITNYIRYMIAQMFTGNIDLSDNIVTYKSSEKSTENPYEDGRWRFAVTDFDNVFCKNDTDIFEQLLEFDLPKEDNTGKYIAIALFQKLWNNETFRNEYQKELIECLGDELSTERLLVEFEKHTQKLEPVIEDLINRTKGNTSILYNYDNNMEVSVDSWKKDVVDISNFIETRPDIMLELAEIYINK